MEFIEQTYQQLLSEGPLNCSATLETVEQAVTANAKLCMLVNLNFVEHLLLNSLSAVNKISNQRNNSGLFYITVWNDDSLCPRAREVIIESRVCVMSHEILTKQVTFACRERCRVWPCVCGNARIQRPAVSPIRGSTDLTSVSKA